MAELALLTAGFAAALALARIRRSAQDLERQLAARDEALVRERVVRTAAEVAAEVERSLHDTALNTLEAIAAHGDHLDPALVAERCRSDVTRLAAWRSGAQIATLDDAVGAIRAHAGNLGLELSMLRLGPGPGPGQPGGVPLPATALSAMTGAACEALTNVAKHAGVRRADLTIVHGTDGLEIVVDDAGIGAGAPGGAHRPDRAPPRDPGPADGGERLGLATSVVERVEAVGGVARVGPGPGGRGTSVELLWQPVRDEGPGVSGDLLVHAAGAAVRIGVLLAGIASALVVLDWSSYQRPWFALAGPLIAVLVSAALLDQARAGIRIGADQVAAAALAYLTVGAMRPLADPGCGSLLGEGMVLDARAALLATVLLLAPRARVLAALLATLVAAHLGTALLWNHVTPGCGTDTASASVFLMAGLTAAWLFARRVQRLGAEYDLARAEAAEAEVRIRAGLAVRAEEELWVRQALRSAQEILDAIAQGRMSPAGSQTRAQCAAEAESLRALIAVGRAPVGLRAPARIWLGLLRSAGCRARVRGLAGCHPPPRLVGQVGATLDTVCALAPNSTVVLSGWTDPEQSSLTVTAQGPGVAARTGALLERVGQAAGSAWRDVSDDCLTVEWSWPTGEVPAGAPGG